jgi:hypothetical protein
MTNRPSHDASTPGLASDGPADSPHASATPGHILTAMSESPRRRQLRREAAEAIWEWKPRSSEPAARPGRRVRWTAVRDFAIGLGVAVILYVSGRSVLAGMAAAIASVMLAVAVLLPPALSERVSTIAGRVAHAVGHVVTIAALAVVYFSLFLLLRGWRILVGNDSLRLRARPHALSYWIDRSTLPETSPDNPY